MTSSRAISPHRLLAEQLGRRVDELFPWLEAQNPEVRERFLDVLAGLSRGEEAMHALAREDVEACLDHLRASLDTLESTSLDGLRGPFTTP